MSSEPEVTVELRWSETHWYGACIPLADLAGAITGPGQENGGHSLPADLADLAGDPFRHGNLIALLRNLEDRSAEDTDGIEVHTVKVRDHDQRPPAPAELATSALAFAGAWAELAPALPDDYGCTLTCDEAETMRDLLAAAGYHTAAAAVMAAHAAHDDPGDAHCQPPIRG